MVHDPAAIPVSDSDADVAGVGTGEIMVADETRTEIEQFLGRVPSWIATLSPSASDHSWGIVRDLMLGETVLPNREKALVGLGAAAAIQCPYCVRFHRAEATLEGVTEEEMTEAVNVASAVKYFSTTLHGAEVDQREFADETAAIVEHVEEGAESADD